MLAVVEVEYRFMGHVTLFFLGLRMFEIYNRSKKKKKLGEQVQT